MACLTVTSSLMAGLGVGGGAPVRTTLCGLSNPPCAEAVRSALGSSGGAVCRCRPVVEIWEKMGAGISCLGLLFSPSLILKDMKERSNKIF